MFTVMQRTTQGESTDRCHIIFQVKWKKMAAWHVRQNAAKKSLIVCMELDSIIVNEILFVVKDINIANAQVCSFKTYHDKYTLKHMQAALPLCPVLFFYAFVFYVFTLPFLSYKKSIHFSAHIRSSETI